MDELLFFLLKKGAHRNPFRISTTAVGAALGISQQNASRKLILLEKGGMIERTANGIMLTGKGLEQMKGVYYELKHALEGTDGLELKGTITDGLKEGQYYLSMSGYKTAIKKKLGFVPFQGTLNIKLEKNSISHRMQLRELEPIIIEGFTKKNRSFGGIFGYKCLIDGRVNGAIIIPMRTHHNVEIIELIAPCNLKRVLKKKTGDMITVKVG